MKICEIDYNGGPEINVSGFVWCVTHRLPADHDGGDSGPVCAALARFSGCKCCPENHDKLNMSARDELGAFILQEIAKNGDEITKAIVADLLGPR